MADTLEGVDESVYGADDRFEQHTRDEAAEKGWAFEKLSGDLSLIQRLVDGQWDDAEFLVVLPGQRVAASYDETIITLETKR